MYYITQLHHKSDIEYIRKAMTFVEYGMGSKISRNGDVYSYGILLLEMFTGKNPTDDMFKDGLDLYSYVKMALPEKISDILDPLFLVGGSEEKDEEATINKAQIQNCLIAILGIGVACSVETPRDRMSISDVVKELKVIRGELIPMVE